MNNRIRIPVRQLVEFVFRSGDIDNRFVGRDIMIEGTKAHRKIQKSGGDSYISEVFFCTNFEYMGIDFIIDGRADGVIADKDVIIIDEIKSTTTPLDKIEEDSNIVHWAQAKCYAYIYAQQNKILSISIQLTYYQLDTEEIKRYKKVYNFIELESFFYDLIDKYMVWANLTTSWSQTREESIKKLNFPYESYRKGQRELAIATYKTIIAGRKLFAQAPTGIGKTISTIFPAVKAMGESQISKIFYLTAKTITRQVAQEAFIKMQKNGLRFKVLTLTAKDKICFCEESNCNVDNCLYAKGHYDRVNDAILDIIINQDNITRELIEEYARRYNVCPFEYSLDLSLWVDCIICDYNYVFDPQVYLRRFFAEQSGDYAFLIDEAHNLVDRAREMFSAEINKSAFLKLQRSLKKKDSSVKKVLKEINSFMIKLRKECEDIGYKVSVDEYKEINKLLLKFIEKAEIWLKINQMSAEHGDVLELYFESITFLKIAELYDDRYVSFVETKKSDVRLKLFCLDPSYLLSEALKRGKAAILFSATLTPLDYFKYILGGGKEDSVISLESPFDRENLNLMISNRISTKYVDRDDSCLEIVEFIKILIANKLGNYMVYFPSYKYMTQVYKIFSELCPEISTIIQEIDMSEEEREKFLDRFSAYATDTLIGFSVLGGVFSEGIDLQGDRLIGSIIIGVGLPQLSIQLDIIKNYFNNLNGQGYEFAYMYPGMNKVLQAAGRVIRSENDKGVVLLIDERFGHYTYKRLFPAHWQHYKLISCATDLQEKLKDCIY